MLIQYRVIDLRTDISGQTETIVEKAISPEEAARMALGVDLQRGTNRLRLPPSARVYFQPPGQPMTMVRLYPRPPAMQADHSAALESSAPR